MDLLLRPFKHKATPSLCDIDYSNLYNLHSRRDFVATLDGYENEKASNIPSFVIGGSKHNLDKLISRCIDTTYQYMQIEKESNGRIHVNNPAFGSDLMLTIIPEVNIAQFRPEINVKITSANRQILYKQLDQYLESSRGPTYQRDTLSSIEDRVSLIMQIQSLFAKLGDFFQINKDEKTTNNLVYDYKSETLDTIMHAKDMYSRSVLVPYTDAINLVEQLRSSLVAVGQKYPTECYDQLDTLFNEWDKFLEKFRNKAGLTTHNVSLEQQSNPVIMPAY